VSLYDGILGSKEDGAYPGRAGKNTIFSKLREIRGVNYAK